MNLFMLASMLIKFGLIRWQQWWPKWHPVSLVAANMIHDMN